MTTELPGLHHVTAIAADPQRNVDFYTGVLGLRLVKITINYDDPGSYHFYYGDETGRPGSILTFFAWPGGYPGRRGTSQVTVTSLSVPEGSLGWWQQHFDRHAVRHDALARRRDEEAMAFYDPDGLPLELVAHRGAEEQEGWQSGSVPLEYGTRGLYSVTLALQDPGRTARLLTETMGFRLLRDEDGRARYVLGEPGCGRTLDILSLPHQPQGVVGVGSVHHVAWRTPTDVQQQAWHEQLTKLRYHVSPVMDRQYFHSIYFREPGGVLFEIATDGPGFTTDEALDKLGASLRLPAWLEPDREQIQRRLRPLTLTQTSDTVATVQDVPR